MRIASAARLLSVVGVALFAASSAAQGSPATPITDLYNTGMSSVWNAATPVAAGTETHWTVGYNADYNPSLPTATSVSVYTPGPEQENLDDPATSPTGTNMPASQWIAPGTSANGSYIYTVTFTTADPLSAIHIEGFVKSDLLSQIKLDGTNESVITPGGFSAGSAAYLATTPAQSFNIYATVAAGTHTLSFEVSHFTSLAASELFRVQFTDATAMTVPEPSTFALGALGLIGFGMTRLRRRAKAVAEAK